MNKNLFILFAAFFLITGCSNQNKVKTNYEQKEITLTLYSADLTEPKKFSDEIAQEITRRSGVTLEFIPSKGNSADDIDIMIANDSFPDLIYAKSDITKLINAKAVIPLDPYIDSYGQNIKKLYGKEYSKLRFSIEDPQIYTFGTYAIKSNVLETSGNIQIQNAVLKEFQYPKIKTLDQLENLLMAYKKRWPVINGHETIGFSMLTDSWYWYLFLSNPGNYMIGYPDDGQWIVDQESLKATYKFLHPEMNKFYKWLNRIYNKGLLDPESFTQDITLFEQKMEEGYVLCTSAPLWMINSIEEEMEKNGLMERTFAFLPVTVDENKKDQSLKNYGFSGGWGIAVTKNCRDKYEAVKFFDWLCSEEAQILLNWGIENKHYYYNQDNIRHSVADLPNNVGIGNWLYPFPQAGEGYIDSTGNTIAKTNLDQIKADYNYAKKDTLKAYDVEYFKDLFPSAEELGDSRHGQIWLYQLSPGTSELVNSADEFVKNSLINLIVSSETEFDENWKFMQDTLINLGIKEAEDEVTNLIKMKIQLWSE